MRSIRLLTAGSDGQANKIRRSLRTKGEAAEGTNSGGLWVLVAVEMQEKLKEIIAPLVRNRHSITCSIRDKTITLTSEPLRSIGVQKNKASNISRRHPAKNHHPITRPAVNGSVTL